MPHIDTEGILQNVLATVVVLYLYDFAIASPISLLR